MSGLSRRAILRATAATAALAAPAAAAAALPMPDIPDPIIALVSKYARVCRAAARASERAQAIFQSLPERVRKPCVTITTPSGATLECRDRSDVWKAFAAEKRRHPKARMSAWPDELLDLYWRGSFADCYDAPEEARAAHAEYVKAREAYDHEINDEVCRAAAAAEAQVDAERAYCEQEEERLGYTAADKAAGELWERAGRLTNEIMTGKPTTLAGLLAQIRHLHQAWEEGSEPNDSWLDSLVANAGRLIEGERPA